MKKGCRWNRKRFCLGECYLIEFHYWERKEEIIYSYNNTNGEVVRCYIFNKMFKIILFMKICLKSNNTFSNSVIQLITISFGQFYFAHQKFWFIISAYFSHVEINTLRRFFPRICVQWYFIFPFPTYRKHFLLFLWRSIKSVYLIQKFSLFFFSSIYQS